MVVFYTAGIPLTRTRLKRHKKEFLSQLSSFPYSNGFFRSKRHKKGRLSAALLAVCVRREKTHRVWEDPLLDDKIPKNFCRIMCLV